MNTLKPQVTISTEGELITVSLPYNPRMIEIFRAHGGKWNSTDSVWSLPSIQENMDMLKEMFNWVPGCRESWVTIYNAEETKLKPCAEPDGDRVYYRGYILASRKSKRARVHTYPGVCVKGHYAEEGGSAKYPNVMEGNTVSSWQLLMYDGVSHTCDEGDRTAAGIETSNLLAEYSDEELIYELESRGYFREGKILSKAH